MMTEIRQLQPPMIWKNFSDLNAVPRASKKEADVIAFMIAFGQNLGFETESDDVGNVIIRKPATSNMQDRTPIVLQAHLDMVHQKNNDVEFDFNTQGIQMYVEGDWVKARGTTLGADNGIGVATIMAILESNDMEHPAIEALFTVDEETGMTGAMGLKKGCLQGKILLNLDTEEDDEIGVGCAGGVDVIATRPYDEVENPKLNMGYHISVKGLQGGHSGMQIHEGLGNANKIMNRVLYHTHVAFGFGVSEINGGGLRNAIPRESQAIIAIDAIHNKDFIRHTNALSAMIKDELKTMEPHLEIKISKTNTPKLVMHPEAQDALIKGVYAAINGVYRMNPNLPSLVETSNNIARVLVKNGDIHIGCLTRSSVESSKIDISNTLRTTFELAGFKVKLSGDYPGWAPNMDSPILQIMTKIYQELNHNRPKVSACHAGLECGILGQNYPEMDMISFGPNIKGAHSPEERVQITSVQKFWKFILEVLKQMPLKH